MNKLVSQKMGIEANSPSILINAPSAAMKAISPPALDVASTLRGRFGYIHFLATSQASLVKRFPLLKKPLSFGGMLWISWQKRG
jgi:hypothetical protein